MIFYKYQLIKLSRYKEPAIYLGYDTKDTKKIWVVCLDNADKPEIDWFNESMVEYYKTKSTKDNGTPGNNQIVFGKYKVNLPNHYYNNDLSKEDLDKFGKYVEELYNKYKETEETSK